ncbi:thioredoxin TrxC [Photobacterium makurazakiensis]|uniref:thioredoxin TrxC n=1 Tax=Photobacterium makurazakiensis TaxID=2910234 RepID=UPI003D0EE543
MKTLSIQCPHCKKEVLVTSNALSNTVSCEYCRKPLLDGKPVEADSSNLEKIIQSPVPVVVIFLGDNCAPCKTFKPIVDKVAAEKTNKVRFVRVNINKNKALVSRYRIRGVPTIIAFKKGRQQAVLNTALRKKEFSAWLDDSLTS